MSKIMLASRRILKSKTFRALGSLTLIGAGLYYIDVTNEDRFHRQMVYFVLDF